MKITVYAIGRARDVYADLCAEYMKRLTGSLALTIKEFPTGDQKSECATLLAALPAKTYVVLLDERGKDLSSRELAAKLNAWRDENINDIAFVIGGADGFTDEVRARANFILGLGHKTWPHKLVRVMLLEQLYRAQQINSGHPYHRD